MYVEQIKQIAAELDIPVLTGTTAQRKRDAIYDDFKAGRIGVLAVWKIANFAVDLPDAVVAIRHLRPSRFLPPSAAEKPVAPVVPQPAGSADTGFGGRKDNFPPGAMRIVRGIA